MQLKNRYWIGLFAIFIFLPLFSYANNGQEGFGCGGGGGHHGGGGGHHGGGDGHGWGGYGSSGYYYGGSGYGYIEPIWYYPSTWGWNYPVVWYNNYFSNGCKNGCTKIKDGMWGCLKTNETESTYNDCYFASDCYNCFS